MSFSSQDETVTQKSCLIIGGGISGLMAGTVLQRNGIHATVLDKGRGIGGRLASRRISHSSFGEGVFDYGAQFFTVEDSRFQGWVDEWLREGIVGEWSRQLSDDGKPCYRGIKSNRSIAQHLAKNLEIQTQTRITEVTWNTSQWLVQTEAGSHFQTDSLLITSPIPQSLALLDAKTIAIPPDLKHRLEAVIYQPCIAVLALLDQPSLIPEPGGLRVDDALAWIACNQKKGISPQGSAVTLHATPEFSQTHWETDNNTLAEKLFEIATPWLGSTVVEFQVHRWRYSQPQTYFGKSYLALQKPGLLVMAGDAFASDPPNNPSSNLEKAVLSGLEAANYLLNELRVETTDNREARQ